MSKLKSIYAKQRESVKSISPHLLGPSRSPHTVPWKETLVLECGEGSTVLIKGSTVVIWKGSIMGIWKGCCKMLTPNKMNLAWKLFNGLKCTHMKTNRYEINFCSVTNGSNILVVFFFSRNSTHCLILRRGERCLCHNGILVLQVITHS